MSIGFRKSLFGFNSDDVMEYIEKSHKNFVEKETILNEKIDDLTSSLDNAKTEIASILTEKEQVEVQLKQFTDKYEEIERLSQNIGKLYLVAQANSKSVMDNAKKNLEVSSDEVLKNIAYVNNTQDSLSTLKNEVNKTSREFTEKLEALINSLEKTKSGIRDNDIESQEKIEEYTELVESINA